MCKDQSARIIIKRGSGVPTIPVSADHRNGDWIATDIYEGEFYQDTATGIVYTRNGATIEFAGTGSENFANADLTVTGTRVHDLDGNTVGFTEGNTTFINSTATSGTVLSVTGDTNGTALEVTNTDNSQLALDVVDGFIKFQNLPVYANEAAAVTGGLATGVVYQTATGELRIKL